MLSHCTWIYLSATDCLHQLLGIPFPLDRDLGGGTLNLAQVFGRQFHGERSNVFVEAMRLGGAWNRNNPRLLGQHPGECDLCRCRFLPLCDCANQIDQRLVRLARLRREARQGAAEIRAVEARRFVDLARQEALAKRAVGYQSDSEFLDGWNNFLLMVPKPQRVFAL